MSAPPKNDDTENIIDKLLAVFAEVAVRGKSAQEPLGCKTCYGRWVRGQLEATVRGKMVIGISWGSF